MADKSVQKSRGFLFSSIRTKPKIISVALFPLLLILGVGAFIMANLMHMQETSDRVDQTRQILADAGEIMVTATEMETGLRGYLLAGREEYLEPYIMGQEGAHAALSALRMSVKGDAEQVERLDQAAQVLRDWQSNVADPEIELRRAIGDAPTMNDMAAAIKSGKGQEYFEQFRREIVNFIEEADVQLENQRQVFTSMVKSGIADPEYLTYSLDMVSLAYRIINLAKDLQSAAVDMETGYRGYLLAGEASFLAPYEAGAERYKSVSAALMEAIAEEPLQINRLNKMNKIIDTWRSEVVQSDLDLRTLIGDARTMDDMADLVAEGRGKTYFDEFRDIMGAFRAAEQEQMASRQAANLQISEDTRTMIPIAIGVAILLGAIMALVTGTSIARGVKTITVAMQGLAGGDNAVEIKGQARGDEVGDMARALEVFRVTLVRMQEAEKRKAESKDAEQSAVVQELSERLSQLAEGQLDIQIDRAFPEEYEKLRTDFNASVSTLNSIVQQVIEASGSIGNGAEEISHASDDLSRRTESQAATLEETAAALDQLTASVKAAAEGARSVENTMTEAGAEAENSGEVVRNAVSAMNEIEQSSRHISQIIGVIDDIAFQTNLLALNAGVEAARAGEAGRGFAVVASEVRALAQRSSDAAMEIKTLISESATQVERGVDLVGRAGAALNSIVGRVKEISQQVTGIADGAERQSTGLHEINIGMTQLDQVTQQNAAMVEESTAASHLLKSDASKLRSLMGHFHTGAAVAPAASATRASEQSYSAHGWVDAGDDWDAASDSWEAEAPAAATGTDDSTKWQDF